MTEDWIRTAYNERVRRVTIDPELARLRGEATTEALGPVAGGFSGGAQSPYVPQAENLGDAIRRKATGG